MSAGLELTRENRHAYYSLCHLLVLANVTWKLGMLTSVSLQKNHFNKLNFILRIKLKIHNSNKCVSHQKLLSKINLIASRVPIRNTFVYLWIPNTDVFDLQKTDHFIKIPSHRIHLIN